MEIKTTLKQNIFFYRQSFIETKKAVERSVLVAVNIVFFCQM